MSIAITDWPSRPSEVDRLAWASTCSSVACLALVMTGSSVWAYVFLASGLSLILLNARSALGTMLASPTIWFYPAFAMTSTIWSEAPAHSFRSSLEVIATIACGIFAARKLQPRQFVLASLFAYAFIAAFSLSVRGVQVDPLTGATDFVGPFPSKNQLAFSIALLILTSLAVLVENRSFGIRALGMICLATCLPLLILAKSATSDLTALACAVAFLGNLYFSRLTLKQRVRVAFALGVVSLPLLILFTLLGSEIVTDVLSLLGKDATLTGRTELWERAFQLIPEHPWLGQGYRAFWRDDYVEVEALFEKFQVAGGFHFHNTILETTIETGYVGSAVLASIFILTLIRCISWSWRTGSTGGSYFVTIMLLLLLRSMVEVDLLDEFTVGTYLFAISYQYSQTYREAGMVGHRVLEFSNPSTLKTVMATYRRSA